MAKGLKGEMIKESQNYLKDTTKVTSHSAEGVVSKPGWICLSGDDDTGSGTCSSRDITVAANVPRPLNWREFSETIKV